MRDQKCWGAEIGRKSLSGQEVSGEPHGHSQTTGLQQLLFSYHGLKYIMCFHFCFTSFDIWNGLFLLFSLVTLNLVTSCSGLPLNLFPLPMGNYIRVCHLPSGHAGEHWDKSFIQFLGSSTSSVNKFNTEVPSHFTYDCCSLRREHYQTQVNSHFQCV